MKRFKNSKPWARAVSVMAALAIIVSGVTFAALQSQQETLTGNTLESVLATLQISTNGTTFGDTQTGSDTNGILPGGPAMPVNGDPIYLKNTGTSALALKLAVPSIPVVNPATIDLSKVNVLLTSVSSGAVTHSFSLKDLMAASTTGGLDVGEKLNNNTTQQYKLQFSMGSDVVNGPSAALAKIDLAFSGVAVSN